MKKFGIALALALVFSLPTASHAEAFVSKNAAIYQLGAAPAFMHQTVLTQAPDAGVPGTTVPALDSDISESGGLFKAIFDAFTKKNWVLGAAWLLSALVFLLRWASKKFGILPFFTTDRGGVVLVFALSLFGGFATRVAAEGVAAIKWTLILECFTVAISAIGGFVGLKKVLFPSDAK